MADYDYSGEEGGGQNPPSPPSPPPSPPSPPSPPMAPTGPPAAPSPPMAPSGPPTGTAPPAPPTAPPVAPATPPLPPSPPDVTGGDNPIVVVNLIAKAEDGWRFLKNNSPYEGPYHLHQDGTAMIGGGVLGVVHELVEDEIIFQEQQMETTGTESQEETSEESEGDTQETEESEEGLLNPITEINLIATEQDRIYFKNNLQQQYIGEYHKHSDGTFHVGKRQETDLDKDDNLSVDLENVLIEKFTFESLQQVREIVSDLFYKLWFESNTLTEQQLLSMQTTIRDGIKQTGRGEDEPLVFYKKDRNTLENRDDLQGEVFEEVCQSIYQDNLPPEIIEQRFTFTPPVEESYTSEEELPVSFYYMRKRYGLRYESLSGQVLVIAIANELILYEDVPEMGALERSRFFTDILNLSQLVKPKTGTKIDADKASEVLDTNIFELLPTQTTRQDEINSFFQDFNNLIGPKPGFQDVDGDGIGEQIVNLQSDTENRISAGDNPNAFITRLDSDTDNPNNGEANVGKTLESMRNRLNTYLGDVDNVVQVIPDSLDEYENKSTGFLKIRKPNQAIIIRSEDGGLLELQKDVSGKPSFLTNGFTVTMWVRFVSKVGRGTLFNLGNPTAVDNPYGFRLETIAKEYDKNRRIVRLIVRDGDNLYDSSIIDPNPPTPRQRYNTIENNAPAYREGITDNRFFDHIQVPTNNLDEWFFICATYNPSINEAGSFFLMNTFGNDPDFWLNHKNQSGDFVSNSGLGAKCKVEIISRSDLLRARGYKVKSLQFNAPPPSFDVQEGEIETTGEVDNIA